MADVAAPTAARDEPAIDVQSLHMRACRFGAYGPPHVLAVEQVRLPPLGEHEVLVRVLGCGINPLDLNVRAGRVASLMPRELPSIPGWDLAGNVVKRGKSVEGWAPGTPVAAMLDYRASGAACEYVAVPALLLAERPVAVAPSVAAGLVTPALTGRALAQTVQGAARVLVAGALGNVGHWFAQFARENGARTLIGLVARDRGMDAAGAGYDRLVTAETMREGQVGPVDAVVDLVGGSTRALLRPWLVEGGVLVGTTEPPSDADFARGIRASMLMVRPDPPALEAILRGVAEGRYAASEVATIGLDDVAALHAAMEAGIAPPKTVIVP
ncbi:NADP-dependent oxidoreductase [Sandaracinobacteroides saxicola]|uniref:NADP-dependent oxidoreductase n=1 Tax=Sandaracinobacteroides saxicola TaxID=2759707 RepID=A0A7G5IE03_9SPHN|nr:NADP-dependent oxidoreductase [Sandaracinobacteroides saxicola]QMW21595.1 NADP-dependent oxidoreductase [Sandaracinobacteroides saxicola]